MAQQDDSQDLLKRVTSAALKAVSESRDVTVTYAYAQEALVGASGKTVRLPSPSRQVSAEELMRLRGAADAAALRLRYHDESMHRRRRPDGAEAAAIFERAEQVRVEALGARRLAGVADNLDAFLENRCKSKGLEDARERDPAMLPEAVGLMVRECLTGAPPPPSGARLLDLWRPWLMEKAGDELASLDDAAGDQRAFAKALSSLIRQLDLMDETDGALDYDDSQDEQQGEQDPNEESSPEGQGSEQESEGAMAGESSAGEEEGQADSAAMSAEEDMASAPGGEDPAGPTRWNNRWENDRAGDPAAYRAYSTESDEVIGAEGLCESEELTRLRAQLDQQLSRLQGVVARLANRLQRRLMA
ncbi:MAG: cobaltochelatase subunit CobT, partial [Hyphomicrobiaceae bacterium]|nr:cobaltochelatase subunit CobT [Hyphomicrobiaceae bacterium]